MPGRSGSVALRVQPSMSVEGISSSEKTDLMWVSMLSFVESCSLSWLPLEKEYIADYEDTLLV